MQPMKLLGALLLAAGLLSRPPPVDAVWSSDVRGSVLAMYYDGYSPEKIVANLLPMTLMCERSVYRWAAMFRQTGEYEPLGHRTAAYAVAAADWPFIQAALEDDNTSYLHEVAASVLVMAGTLYTAVQLSRELARRGVTHKLSDVRAMERDPIKRTQFAEVLNDWPLDHYVSIDESAPRLLTRPPLATAAPRCMCWVLCVCCVCSACAVWSECRAVCLLCVCCVRVCLLCVLSAVLGAVVCAVWAVWSECCRDAFSALLLLRARAVSPVHVVQRDMGNRKWAWSKRGELAAVQRPRLGVNRRFSCLGAATLSAP